MGNIIAILITAILSDNYVLAKFLGICPFLGVSKKLDSALGMSVAVTLVMVLATAVTWPIQMYLLDPNGLGYLQTIVFILVIASLVQLVETFLKKFLPPLHRALGVYLPLITTNCAVLGVAILNVESYPHSFVYALINALGAGLGFLLAMVIFAGVRSRVEKADIPDFLKGLPVTLVSAAITSLAFMGFQGIGG